MALIFLFPSISIFSSFRHLPPWADQRMLTYDQKCSSFPLLASWPSAEPTSQLQGGNWDREAKCQRWGEIFFIYFAELWIFFNVLNLCCGSWFCSRAKYIFPITYVYVVHISQSSCSPLQQGSRSGIRTQSATKIYVGHSRWEVLPFVHSKKYNILFLLQDRVHSLTLFCERPPIWMMSCELVLYFSSVGPWKRVSYNPEKWFSAEP